MYFKNFTPWDFRTGIEDLFLNYILMCYVLLLYWKGTFQVLRDRVEIEAVTKVCQQTLFW